MACLLIEEDDGSVGTQNFPGWELGMSLECAGDEFETRERTLAKFRNYPRKSLAAPSLEGFKARLDQA